MADRKGTVKEKTPTLVIEEQGERKFRAYLDSDPDICGVGKTASAAVTAIVAHMLGDLVLHNPASFGLSPEIIYKPSQKSRE